MVIGMKLQMRRLELSKISIGEYEKSIAITLTQVVPVGIDQYI